MAVDATNSTKQRVELTWIGKEHRPRLEPCVTFGPSGGAAFYVIQAKDG